MWRLWVLVLVNPIWGEEVFIDGEDVGYLERRLDDVKVLGDVAVRWRVRGAEGEWERLQVYQRVEWEPRAVEVARDGVGRWGMVGAFRARLRGVRWRVLGRYYAPGFHSFFGGAPGASGMQNELGGVAVVSGRRWRVYADVYRRPQRSYFVPVAATCATWGTETNQRLGQWIFRGQWQGRQRPRWRDGRLEGERSQRGRLDVDYGGWRWRGEVQRLGGARAGWGALGSARFRRRWLTLHLSRFRTASYATRIYEYEVDFPGSVSIRPLYGSGWRGYALVSVGWRGWALSGRYRLQWDRQIRRYGGVQVDWTAGDIDKR